MGFFKQLFGSSDNADEEKRHEQMRSFDTLKYEAVAALRHGKPQAAVPRLRAALQIEDDMECHDYLSQALVMAGELEEAVTETELLASLVPDNAAVYLRLANIYYMKEDYDGVATAAQRAIEAEPENATAFLYLSRAAHGRGDNVVAIAMADKCIGFDDKMVDAYMLRCKLHLAQHNLDQAEADAAWLSEHQAESEDAALLRGHVAEARLHNDEALALYTQAIDLNPFCTAAYAARAALKLKLGDKEGAEADHQAMIEADPSINDPQKATTEGQNIEETVMQAYRNIDPFAVF